LSFPNQLSMKTFDSGARQPPLRWRIPSSASLSLNARGGKGGPIGAERELASCDPAHGRGPLDELDPLSGAAAQLELPGDSLVLESIAAIRWHQPCSATHTLVMSSWQSCRGRSTRKKLGRLGRASGRRRCSDQPLRP
jgi:hypothetical protein